MIRFVLRVIGLLLVFGGILVACVMAMFVFAPRRPVLWLEAKNVDTKQATIAVRKLPIRTPLLWNEEEWHVVSRLSPGHEWRGEVDFDFNPYDPVSVWEAGVIDKKGKVVNAFFVRPDMLEKIDRRYVVRMQVIDGKLIPILPEFPSPMN